MIGGVDTIVSQHADEAAFLWSQRRAAVSAPHVALADVHRFDDRIEAHVDGLRANGEAGWKLGMAAADGGDAGAVFAMAVLAVEAGDPTRIDLMLAVAAASADAARGLVSALGWLPFDRARPVVTKSLASDVPALRRAGIAAAAVHRQHPGPALGRALAASDPALVARACRAVGELAAADGRTAVRAHLTAADPAVRYRAAWAGTVAFGDPAAVAALQAIAERGGPFAADAAAAAVRRLEPPAAEAWVRQLAGRPAGAATAIAAAGAAGDPAAVPWLVRQMAVPATARRAGEALSLITGVHVAYDKLERPPPAGFDAGPNDDPADENVALDPDEDLAWPDPALVEKWWSANKARFPAGTRHLLGKPMSDESLSAALRTGYQRQRRAAALELAMRRPGEPLFEVRAPAARQRRLLGIA